MLEKLNQFVDWMHSKGIPLPTLRDPKHGEPSVSYTMMVMSFSVCLIGLLGNVSKFLEVDMSQSLMLFTACSALYFGRQSQINTANKTIDISAEEKKQ